MTTPCGTTAGSPIRCRSRSSRYSRNAIVLDRLLDGVDPVLEPHDPHHVAGQAARQRHDVVVSPLLQRRRPGQRHDRRVGAARHDPQGHGRLTLAPSGDLPRSQPVAAERCGRRRGSVGRSSSSSGSPSGPESGICQLGYSRCVPGWFWVRRSPTRSATLTPSSRLGDRVSSSWSAATVSSSVGASSASSPRRAQLGEEDLPLALGDRELLVDGPGQQAERLAQPDVLAERGSRRSAAGRGW